MKFLCLVCAESLLEDKTEAEAERLMEEYRVLIEDLQRVQKAAQKITSILDLDQLIDGVASEVTQSFGCLEAGIYLYDEQHGGRRR